MAHPNAALSMNQNFAGADVKTVPGGKDIAARDSRLCEPTGERHSATRLLGAERPSPGGKWR